MGHLSLLRRQLISFLNLLLWEVFKFLYGNPIILLNDKQTVGGYTKIATVTLLDLKKLAQLKPGETIHFEWISVEEATQQLQEFEQTLKN